MHKLILLRHAQSIWNVNNIFTGWVDIPLSMSGIEQAMTLRDTLKNTNIDRVFSSALIRAQQTILIALTDHPNQRVPVIEHNTWSDLPTIHSDHDTIPVCATTALNERCYGKLQGLNKDHVVEEFGDAKVKSWRRSYTDKPPSGESLQETQQRVVPYYIENILPHLQHETCLVCAHGNSLRALIMHIENIEPNEISDIELACSQPRVYTYTNQQLIRSTL